MCVCVWAWKFLTLRTRPLPLARRGGPSEDVKVVPEPRDRTSFSQGFLSELETRLASCWWIAAPFWSLDGTLQSFAVAAAHGWASVPGEASRTSPRRSIALHCHGNNLRRRRSPRISALANRTRIDRETTGSWLTYHFKISRNRMYPGIMAYFSLHLIAVMTRSATSFGLRVGIYLRQGALLIWLREACTGREWM